MSESDGTLLARWRNARDADAFRGLFERHAGTVHTAARRILPSADDADDVTQECFLRLAGAAVRRQRSLAGWLHRVATNLSIDRLRSGERTREVALDPDSQRADEHGTADWREIEHAIDQAIDTLPDGQRLVIVEHYLCGHSHTAIARRLGLSREAVTQRMRTGLATLRQALERRGVRIAPAALATGLAQLPKVASSQLPRAVQEAVTQLAAAGPPTAVAATGKSALGLFAAASAIALTVAAAAGFWLLQNSTTAAPATASAASIDAAPANRGQQPQGSPATGVDGSTAAPTAREARQPTARVAPKPREIDGRVVDADGNPIADAEIAIAWEPARIDPDDQLRGYVLDADYWSVDRMQRTRSDADGRFALRGVPAAGKAIATAFRDGSYGNRAAWDLAEADAERVLELAGGKTFAGSLRTASGTPVVDAIVSVYHAYTKHGYSGSPGFATTDQRGVFRLALDPTTEHLTLRINSLQHGQQFFLHVAADEPAELQLRKPGALRGTIRRENGETAAGLHVRVEANVPDPPMSIFYSGWRILQQVDAVIAADGSYRIDGLLPGFTYCAKVVDPKHDARQQNLFPLSPNWNKRFRVEPDSVEIWDFTLASPIVVRGTVRTNGTRTAVPRMKILVEKDGERQNFVYCESDANGDYELRLSTGPGHYRLLATAQLGFDQVTALLAPRFARELTLRGGDERELDLLMCEPSVLPVRVFDRLGQPAKNIGYELKHMLPGGKRAGLSSSCRLDDQGRHRFEIFHATTETTLVVHAFSDGPPIEVGTFRLEPGQQIEERTIRLPAACDITGQAVDASGTALANTTLRVRAELPDGTRDTFHVSTDGDGRFTKKARLPITAIAVTVDAQQRELKWRADHVRLTVDQTCDLGRIALQ